MSDIKIGDYLDDGIGEANVVKVLDSVGVKLKENETTYRNFSDVIEDLASKWNTLNDVEQKAVAKTVAGTRQQNVFMSLLQNMSRAYELSEESANSSGLAQERYGAYLESTEAKINSLISTLQELYTKTFNSDGINTAIDTLTGIIDLVNDIGGLKPIATTLVGAGLIKNFTMISNVFIDVRKNFNQFKDVFNYFSKNGATTFSALTQSLSLMKNGVVATEKRVLALATAFDIASLSIGAIISVIGLGVMAYNKHKQAQQELIESTDELNNSMGEISKNSTRIEDLSSQYMELKTAMKNGDLSDEDLQKWYDVQAQLKELIPELTSYYDSQGNVILDVATNYDTLTEALRNYNLEKQKDIQESNEEVIESASADEQVLKAKLNQLEILQKIRDGQKLTEQEQYDSDYLGIDISNINEVSAKILDLKNQLKETGLENNYRSAILSMMAQTDDWYNLTDEDITKINRKMSEMSFKDLVYSYDDAKNNTVDFMNTILNSNDEIEESNENAMDSFTPNLEELHELYGKIMTSISDLNSIIDSYDEKGKLTSTNVNKIVKDYPELIQYIGQEAELRDHLVAKLDEQKELAGQTMREMLQAEGNYYNEANAMSEEYYNNKILGNQQTCETLTNQISEYFSSLGIGYEGDLSNYSNMEQAKASITEQLINKLGNAWQTFFNGLSGQFKSMSSAISNIQDPIERLKMGSDNPFTQRMWEQIDKETESKYSAQRDAVKDAMDGLGNLMDSYTFDPVSIDFGDIGGSTKKDGSGKKSKEKKEDISDQLKAIQQRGKLLDEQIKMIENQRDIAEELGQMDKVSDYTKQLSDLHNERKNVMHDENVAYEQLKAKSKEEENIIKLEELMATNSQEWYSEKKAQLEEEIKLIDYRYKTELDNISDLQESLENLYTDIKVNPDEYIDIEEQKLDLLKQQQDIAKSKMKDYLDLGLSEQTDEVRELKNELNSLNKQIIEQSLNNIELKINIKELVFEDPDDLKTLIESYIDQYTYLEDMEKVNDLRSQSVEITLDEIDKNRDLILELKRLQAQEKQGSAEYIKYKEEIQEALERENSLISELMNSYKELASARAESDVYGSGGKDAWEKAQDKKIKSYQEQLDALKDQTDEKDKQADLEEKLLEIEQLREKLAWLKTQRTVQALRQDENGNYQWQYEVNQKSIDETQKELDSKLKDYDDARKEYEKDSEEARLQAIIDSLEDEKDMKQEAYEEAQDNYTKFYQSQLATTINGLSDIDRQTDIGLNNVNKTAKDTLSKIKNTFSDKMESIYKETKKYVAMISEELASVGLSEVPSDIASSSTGSSNNSSSSISYDSKLGAIYPLPIQSKAYDSMLNSISTSKYSSSNISSLAKQTTTSNTYNSYSVDVTLPNVTNPSDFYKGLMAYTGR